MAKTGNINKFKAEIAADIAETAKEMEQFTNNVVSKILTDNGGTTSKTAWQQHAKGVISGGKVGELKSEFTKLKNNRKNAEAQLAKLKISTEASDKILAKEIQIAVTDMKKASKMYEKEIASIDSIKATHVTEKESAKKLISERKITPLRKSLKDVNKKIDAVHLALKTAREKVDTRLQQRYKREISHLNSLKNAMNKAIADIKTNGKGGGTGGEGGGQEEKQTMFSVFAKYNAAQESLRAAYKKMPQFRGAIPPTYANELNGLVAKANRAKEQVAKYFKTSPQKIEGENFTKTSAALTSYVKNYKELQTNIDRLFKQGFDKNNASIRALQKTQARLSNSALANIHTTLGNFGQEMEPTPFQRFEGATKARSATVARYQQLQQMASIYTKGKEPQVLKNQLSGTKQLIGLQTKAITDEYGGKVSKFKSFTDQLRRTVLKSRWAFLTLSTITAIVVSRIIGAITKLGATLIAIPWKVLRIGTRAFYSLGKSVLTTTDTFRQYRIALEGVLHSTLKATKVSQFAAEYAAKYPAMYTDIMKAVTLLAQNPKIKPFISNADTSQLKEFMDIIQVLGRMNPEQGVAGARFAVSEAFAGNFRSMMMRFNLPAEILAGTIGKQRGELTDPSVLLKALKAYTDLNGGSEMLAKSANTLQVHIGNLADKWKQYLEVIGRSGAYQAALNFFKQLDMLWGKILESPLAQKFGSAIETIIAKIMALGQKLISFFPPEAFNSIKKFQESFNKMLDFIKNNIVPNLLRAFTDAYAGIAEAFVPLAVKIGVAIGIAFAKGFAKGFSKMAGDLEKKWAAIHIFMISPAAGIELWKKSGQDTTVTDYKKEAARIASVLGTTGKKVMKDLNLNKSLFSNPLKKDNITDLQTATESVAKAQENLNKIQSNTISNKNIQYTTKLYERQLEVAKKRAELFKNYTGPPQDMSKNVSESLSIWAKNTVPKDLLKAPKLDTVIEDYKKKLEGFRLAAGGGTVTDFKKINESVKDISTTPMQLAKSIFQNKFRNQIVSGNIDNDFMKKYLGNFGTGVTKVAAKIKWLKAALNEAGTNVPPVFKNILQTGIDKLELSQIKSFVGSPASVIKKLNETKFNKEIFKKNFDFDFIKKHMGDFGNGIDVYINKIKWFKDALKNSAKDAPALFKKLLGGDVSKNTVSLWTSSLDAVAKTQAQNILEKEAQSGNKNKFSSQAKNALNLLTNTFKNPVESLVTTFDMINAKMSEMGVKGKEAFGAAFTKKLETAADKLKSVKERIQDILVKMDNVNAQKFLLGVNDEATAMGMKAQLAKAKGKPFDLIGKLFSLGKQTEGEAVMAGTGRGQIPYLEKSKEFYNRTFSTALSAGKTGIAEDALRRFLSVSSDLADLRNKTLDTSMEKLADALKKNTDGVIKSSDKFVNKIDEWIKAAGNNPKDVEQGYKISDTASALQSTLLSAGVFF